jgi:hypothetical protein
MNTLLTSLAAGLLLAIAVPADAGEPAPSPGGFSAGLSVQPNVSAADIGLPLYPGATLWRERNDDGPGASINLWGGVFGLQLHVLKLRSADSVDTVAAYYRDAMAQQGRVVDCGPGAAPEPAAPASGDAKLLRCGKDRAKPGSQLYKVGLPGGVRMVAIEPYEGGSKVQLLRLMLRGD